MSTLSQQLVHILDRPTKIRLAWATLAAFLLALLDMTAIVLMLPLVDLASGSAPTTGLLGRVSQSFGDPDPRQLTIGLTLVVVGLFVAKGLGAMYFSWWLARFKAENRVRTSSAILRHFLTSPFTEISRRSSSELIRTMMDAVAQVYGSVVYGGMQVVINALTLLAILAALTYAAPLPTITLILYLGLASLFYLRVMKPRARRAGTASAAASAAAWKSALAALGGLKEIRIHGSEQVFVRRFSEASLRGVRPAQVSEFIGGAPRYVLEILFVIGFGVLLVATSASTASISGSGSVVGLLGMFVAAGFRTLPAATAIVGNISNVRFGLPYLDLVHAELAQVSTTTHAEPLGHRLDFSDELSVEKLSFTYPDSTIPALKDISLKIVHGTSLALVGGSGSGKTTLVDTLLGLHRPSTGRVAVDGLCINSDLRGWQANIGYVPQDVFLLDATLAENIAFDESRDELDEDRLIAALRDAQLADVVASLPHGIDTEIGERGARLSGGQRQRVGIARALYRKPRLLVLDEATSALDNEIEHQISSTISKLSGKITVVIVAHRLSTVRHADNIALLSDGQIEATGSFEQVRRSSERFDRLVRLGDLS